MQKRAKKKSAGRPPTHIEWGVVDGLLEAGCFGTQIAARIGVPVRVLYDRCVAEKKMYFTDYQQMKREKGNTYIYEAQFQMALEKDRGMLIWLGKQRLGQRDEPKSEEGFSGEIKQFVDFLKEKYRKESSEDVQKE